MFLSAFALLHYAPCDDDSIVKQCEKIALFVKGEYVTHAARQISGGRWTSKLGQGVDIEHELKALEGGLYGSVTQLLIRKIPTD